MIERSEFDHGFIDSLNAVWPSGVPYCREVIDRNLLRYSQAFEDEDGPLWAWGVVELWNHVGSVWLLFDERASEHVFHVVRAARQYLNELEHAGFRRLQGEIHADSPSRRFAAVLGFQTEGILHNYGMNGKGDYAMVARWNPHA